MDALEQLIRDTLAEHADDAPDVAALHERDAGTSSDTARTTQPIQGKRATHRPTRWLAIGAVAATIVAIAAGIVALHGTSASHHTSPGTDVSLPPVPAGMKAVSYHGIELFVPATMRVTAGPCPPARPAGTVFLQLDNTNADCAPPAVGTPGMKVSVAPYAAAEARELAGELRPTSIDGKRAQGALHLATSPQQASGVLEIPDPGVVVQVLEVGTNTRQVSAVLDSVHLAPVDRLGCADHVASLSPRNNVPPMMNPQPPVLLPAHPRSAVVCRYVVDGNWLAGSRRLTAAETAMIVQAVMGSSPGHATLEGYAVHDWVVLHYADRAAWTIDVAGASVSDGASTGTTHGPSLGFLQEG